MQPVENEGSVLVKCLTRFIFFTALELDKNRVIETAPLSLFTSVALSDENLIVHEEIIKHRI